MSDNLDELREKTETGSRLDESIEDQNLDLTQEIVTALVELDDGERSNTIGIRDDSIEALLASLESTGSLDRLGNALSEELGRDGSQDYDRSTIVRLAIRVGIATADPAVMEELRDAKADYAREQL